MGTIVERRTAKGDVRYRAQIQIMRDGKRVRSESKTFSQRRLAREWIRRREAELELQGDVAATASVRDLTFAAAINTYREAVGENFGRNTNAVLRALALMPIGAIQVRDLTPRDFIDHVHWRREQPPTRYHPRGVGPSTLHTDLVYSRLVLRYLRHAMDLPVSPTVVSEAIQALVDARLVSKSSKQRWRRPAAAELRRLDEYLYERWSAGKMVIPLWHLMWLAIYSGRRQDEMARIPRETLDREHGVYLIEGGLKDPRGQRMGRHEAVLPAAGWAVVDQILRDFPGESGVLLSFLPKSAGTAWNRACKMVGIVDLRFHDLRHEALSRLAEDGYTIPQLQQVSLHESWDSLRRYVNLPARRGERVEFQPRM